MNAYLQAFDAYHRDGEPHIPWTAALDFHLQHGVVISDDSLFIMARPCPLTWSDRRHLSLVALDGAPTGYFDDWHIWSAAGDLDSIIELADRCGAENVTFQRRNARLHRTSIDALCRCGVGRRRRMGHGFAQTILNPPPAGSYLG